MCLEIIKTKMHHLASHNIALMFFFLLSFLCTETEVLYVIKTSFPKRHLPWFWVSRVGESCSVFWEPVPVLHHWCYLKFSFPSHCEWQLPAVEGKTPCAPGTGSIFIHCCWSTSHLRFSVDWTDWPLSISNCSAGSQDTVLSVCKFYFCA